MSPTNAAKIKVQANSMKVFHLLLPPARRAGCETTTAPYFQSFEPD